MPDSFPAAYLDNLRTWGGPALVYAGLWWVAAYLDHPLVLRACGLGPARDVRPEDRA